MPRFRTGTKNPLNVYDGERHSCFQAHSAEDAVKLVTLLNAGENVELVGRIGIEVAAPTETPPQAPESAPEAQSAPVGPERPCADCEHAYSTHSFPWPGSGEVCTWGQGYEGRLCGCRGFR